MESRDWSSDVCSSDLFPSHDTNHEYKKIVIDFNTPSIPKIYNHISSQTQKLSIDLFDTKITTTQPQLKNSKFIKNIDFININNKTLTMDIALKSKTNFNIFYLPNPKKLVIDIH